MALGIATQAQVVLDAQGGEDLAALGDLADARLDDTVGREAADVLALQQDLAGAGAMDAGEDMQQGGLAGAIGADDGHQFAGLDLEIHARAGPRPGRNGRAGRAPGAGAHSTA